MLYPLGDAPDSWLTCASIVQLIQLPYGTDVITHSLTGKVGVLASTTVVAFAMLPNEQQILLVHRNRKQT